MSYNLVKDGTPTDRLQEFSEAPDLPGKPSLEWLPFVDERNPSLDDATQKLGPETRGVVGGNSIWSRAILGKSTLEQVEYIIERRADAYVDGTLDLKGGVSGDSSVVLGFIIDAVITELVSRGPSATTEFQDILDMVAAVKAANPKP